MTNGKTLLIFIADELSKKQKTNKEEGIVLANNLWKKALVKKDPHAICELNTYVREWSVGSN